MPETDALAPTVKDEELTLEFVQLEEDTNLRAAGDATRSCATCHFSSDGDAAISYCWNEKLGIMVAGEWLCDNWTEDGAVAATMSEAQQAIAEKKRLRLVVGNEWRTEPRGGQQCSQCRYYNSPDKAISYCWNPNLQVEVGAVHSCAHFEAGTTA